MDRYHYVARRILIMFPLLLGLSLFVFVLIHLAPGDPAVFYLPRDAAVDPAVRQRVRTQLGLDRPLHIQYIRWLASALKGDFGFAYGYGEPVLDLIGSRVVVSVQLQLAGLVLALIVAIPAGIISARHQYSLWDACATAFALLGVSMPPFWLALLLILIFGVHLDLLPVLGPGTNKPLLDRLLHFVMPVAVTSFQPMAWFARFMRSSMLEVLRQDYIVTARGKGLKESGILFRHALPNAILPLITLLGLNLPTLIGGSVIIESIFGWPGIGRLAYDAVLRRDYPTIMGLTMLIATFVMTVNLAVDIAYWLVDPRIEVGTQRHG